MRTVKVAILILILCALGHAQSRSMADTTYGIKGPVRFFRVETAIFELKNGAYAEGPRVVQMEAWFNRDGNRTDLHLYNDKGVLRRRIVLKFDGLKLIEAINYEGAEKMSARVVQTYDNAGRMTETTRYNGDGTLHSKTNLKRNNQGQMLELTQHSAERVLLQHVTTKYDGPTLQSYERTLYRPDGSLQSKENYELANQRSELTSYKPDGSVATKTVRNNLQIAQYGGDGSLQKTTVISPEEQLADEVILNKDGSSIRQWPQLEQLDAHGNWTKQTRWLSDAKGTRPISVAYRILTYY